MEGAIIFASLVVGVAVTDQLTSLHHLLRKGRAVRWDPLCLATALLVTLTIIMVWWGIAGDEAETMTIGGFLPSFLLLVLLFLLAAHSLPDREEVQATGRYDMFAYYDANSRMIWLLYTVASLFSSLTGVVQSAMAGVGRDRILLQYGPDLVIVTFLMGSLIFVRRRWWHWVALVVLYVGPINWLGRSLG
ncbi:hypothetical protein [Sphingomicrobium aestuariivivum]|uniref:hypothetical protein n=1 Tax=Sphingomicrobium aestuariivivum TaxID=1582356 RepID=UPI001FD66B94|nr:hypothetical protein [Sphingomicrobium aestuariivivum]MCJ8190410.1 hypothetical protein [Sphingomicrobium aestuariivivum]